MIPDGPPARALDLTGFVAAAATFAATLRRGDVVLLDGPLGSGKTTFVRAAVAALHGSDDAVSSPTFVVRQRYEGEPPIEHLDLYRIDDPRHLAELAIDDAIGADRITFVEWPERAPGWFGDSPIVVHISGGGDGLRVLRIERP